MRNNLALAETQRNDPDGEARMLRVLRISHSGSVTSYRERERQLVASFPVEVKLIIPERWQHLGGDESEIQESFEVAKAKTYGTGSIPLFAYEYSVIADYLKKFRPHLVDVHEEPYSVSCFEIVQMVERILPSAACVFYSAQNINKRYPPPFSWTEQYVYRKCVGAYPCSDLVKEVLFAKGFRTNSEVIPLGVDPELFKPRQLDRSVSGLQNDAVVIGYFGRLEEYKGVQYVLQALATVGNEANWQVLIVGNGIYCEKLRALAAALGIAERIVWVGEINANCVADYINLCDVTVVPSVTTATWKEQFGRAVTESMACGVPVISSDSGSLPEVVGAAGIIVPEKNAVALADALCRIISNADYRKELGTASLLRVQNQYTWKKIAQMTFAFYQRSIQIKSDRSS
ncbi:glycosyltransferase family 4 protein [soil metagenome]